MVEVRGHKNRLGGLKSPIATRPDTSGMNYLLRCPCYTECQVFCVRCLVQWVKCFGYLPSQSPDGAGSFIVDSGSYGL